VADYTATNYLIPAIKRRLMVPTTQATFQAADFLAVLNAELQSEVVPLLMSVREEYFVAETDVDVTAGTAAYDIPERAIGGDLRDVLMVASDGTTRNLVRLEPEAAVGWPAGDGTPAGFVLKDEQVVLYPAPSGTTEQLRLSYHRRPGVLVDVADVATVSSSTATAVTAVASAPASFTTSAPLDFIRGAPQFRTLSAEVTPSAVSGTSITITTPSGLAAGDYLALAGESPVAQVPLELLPVLVLRACIVIATALGDREMAGMVSGELQAKQQSALTLIANRVKGEQRKMPNGMRRWRGCVGGGWW
jgi:hypothetical protein